MLFLNKIWTLNYTLSNKTTFETQKHQARKPAVFDTYNHHGNIKPGVRGQQTFAIQQSSMHATHPHLVTEKHACVVQLIVVRVSDVCVRHNGIDIRCVTDKS